MTNKAVKNIENNIKENYLELSSSEKIQNKNKK